MPQSVENDKRNETIRNQVEFARQPTTWNPFVESRSPSNNNLTYHLSNPLTRGWNALAMEKGRKPRNNEHLAAVLFPLPTFFSALRCRKKAGGKDAWRQHVGVDESRPRYPVVVVDDVVSSVAPAFLISPFCPPIASASSNLVGVGFSTPLHLHTNSTRACVSTFHPFAYVQDILRLPYVLFFIQTFSFLLRR